MIDKYELSTPQLAKWMEGNVPEALTVMQFSEHYRKRLRTSNIAERVNREIKRRTKVVGIFPNEESCLRLVSAIVCEIDEEWQTGNAYIAIDNES